MAQPSAASPTPSKDDWELATSGQYDPDRIYTRASDNHGHSTVLHIKVSPMLHGEMRALIESGKLAGLRTTSDIVRDALIHRMIHYREMLKAAGKDPGMITSTIQTEVREAELDHIRNKTAQWSRVIEKLDAALTDLITMRDYDTAWYLIEHNQDPEDMTEPFADRLAAVLSKHTAVLRTMAERLPGIDAPRTGPPRLRSV